MYNYNKLSPVFLSNKYLLDFSGVGGSGDKVIT